MTKKILALSMSLLVLIAFKGFASDHHDLVDPPEPTLACAPIQGPGRVTDQDLTSPEANWSTWHVYTMENGPFSSELLFKGYLQFSQRGLLGDWMYFIYPHTRGPDAARHIDHFTLIARLLAPQGIGVDSQQLEQLFHQNMRMMTGVESLLMTIRGLAHTQQAHVYLTPQNIQLRQTLFKGAQILAQGYVDRIISKNGTLSRLEARHVLRLFMNMQNWSTSDEFYKESDWCQRLAQQVIEKTPDLSPMEKLSFIGLGHFAKSASFPGLIAQDYAQEVVDFVTPLLADPAHLKYSDFWMYPLLSKAYFSLNMPSECLKTWREYQRNAPRDKLYSPKDLLNGLEYTSRFSKDTQEIYWWWSACAKFQTAHKYYTSLTVFELRAAEIMANTLIELSPSMAEGIFRQTLAYFNGDGASLLEGPHGQAYRMQRLETIINLGRALTQLNKHDEAAESTFSLVANELGKNFCYLKNFRLTPDQEERIRKSLKSEYMSFIVMLAKQLPQQESTQGHKIVPTLPPVAQAAQLHLKNTFEKNILKTMDRAKDMMATCQKFEDGSSLLDALQSVMKEGLCLQRTLGYIGEPTSSSASSSSSHAASSSGEATPSMVEFRRQLNAFEASVRRIESDFQRAHASHKTTQVKKVEAYLKGLRSTDDTLAPLTLTPAPHKPKAPMGRDKHKTRGARAASSSTQSVSSAASSHGPQRADLLMGKKAQSDYAALSSKLREKFHTLAQEISSKPYQIIGGQGRPERLVTGTGVYLSRRLTDGDRVVYEVTKDADGAVRVIFVSLLGHYKHLARHQESSSSQLFSLDG